MEGEACGLRGMIEKSCNKLLVGKTWWKCGIVPGCLLGVGVMNLGKGEVDIMQKLENRIYRQLLGAQGYAPNATLRGEVGASLMKTRVIDSKLTLVKGMLVSNSTLIKNVLANVRGDVENPWNKKLNEYLTEVGLEYGDLELMSKHQIKKKVRENDNKLWRGELEKLSSVGLYREFKLKVKDDGCYDSGFGSNLLFKARSNTLQLNDRKRHYKEDTDTSCRLCGEGREDMIHFMLKCDKLTYRRNRVLIERTGETTDKEILGGLLFKDDFCKETKEMLVDLWKEREILIMISDLGAG